MSPYPDFRISQVVVVVGKPGGGFEIFSFPVMLTQTTAVEYLLPAFAAVGPGAAADRFVLHLLRGLVRLAALAWAWRHVEGPGAG